MMCAARKTRAWLVGGSVRDALLGRPIHDFDLAVERRAIEIARATADRLDAPMYVLDAERDTARVVTFAPDGARVFLDFAGLRRPSIEADLGLRDFTINAMAIDLDRPDRLIDPFGGQADLAARTIRAVSDRSLLDDPIRALRAPRLAIGLDFRIEPDAERLIREAAELLRGASAERVRDELAQIVALPDAYRNLPWLDDLNLLDVCLPELQAMRDVAQSPPHHWDVWEHTLRMLDVLEAVLKLAGVEGVARGSQTVATTPESVWPDIDRALEPLRPALRAHLSAALSDDRPVWLTLKWAALFHDVAKPSTRNVDAGGRIRFFGHEALGADVVAKRMRALRFSAAEIDRAQAIVRHHMRPHHLLEAGRVSRRAIYRFFRDAGASGVDVVLHALADDLATNGLDLDPDRWIERLDLTRTLLTAYFDRPAETIDPPALITGHDVMRALGLKPGPRIGRILETVREAQAADEVRTREEALAMVERMRNGEWRMKNEE